MTPPRTTRTADCSFPRTTSITRRHFGCRPLSVLRRYIYIYIYHYHGVLERLFRVTSVNCFGRDKLFRRVCTEEAADRRPEIKSARYTTRRAVLLSSCSAIETSVRPACCSSSSTGGSGLKRKSPEIGGISFHYPDLPSERRSETRGASANDNPKGSPRSPNIVIHARSCTRKRFFAPLRFLSPPVPHAITHREGREYDKTSRDLRVNIIVI